MQGRTLRRLICAVTDHRIRKVTVGTDKTDAVVATAIIRYCLCLRRMEITGWGVRRG